MSGFLLDTHVWIWHLQGSNRLPSGLRTTIDEHPRDCWLSPASIWELDLLEARGRVSFDRSLREWVTRSLEVLPLRDAVLTSEVALVSSELDPSLRDPADRFIVASTLVYELALMTVDDALVQAEWIETRST